jgi:hypothetical protein
VSGDRVGNVMRFARFTNDRWDNTVGVCDQFDTRLDDGALGSFHGSRRVTQFLQWAAPSPLARVTQAERRELRLAVSSAAGSEPAIEGGSVRDALRTAPDAAGERCRRGLCRALGCTFRSFTTPCSLFDCLVDRFGKPLRRFNALAPLDSSLSGSHSATRSCRARAPQVCYVLDSWLLRHRERLSRRQ